MSPISPRWHLRFLSAALSAVMAFCPSACAESAAAETAQTTVQATCTEAGYSFVTNPDTGGMTVVHLPALGHQYGEWLPYSENAARSRLCERCGNTETWRISTVPEKGFPTLYLTGSLEGIGKKQKVTLEARFASQAETFSCHAVMTLQGHSTFGRPKHNYTVRFFHDAKGNSKYYLRFPGWSKEHKYILKANYDDPTQCRNLTGAQIWREMAACRKNLPQQIAALPLLGAADGFPVQVYLNGEYFGLYTMNLHKDNDLYQMQDGERAALIICNRQTAAESLFRGPAAFTEDYTSDWEIEYCGTRNDAWARESFNQLIDFVMTSTDEEFRAGLHRHLDVNSAIDYLLFIYALGLSHSGAKDLVMLSFGDTWIPSAYDMDEAFGLDMTDMRFLAPEEFLPSQADGRWDSATGSLLWDRLLNGFLPEIRTRYASLRAGVLSAEHLLSLADARIGSIPEAFYDMDMSLYEDRPFFEQEMHMQISDYIPKRLAVLDTILEVDDE